MTENMKICTKRNTENQRDTSELECFFKKKQTKWYYLSVNDFHLVQKLLQ